MMTSLFQKILLPSCLPIVLTITLFMISTVDAAKVRIKDICTFQDKSETDLIGYGLVVGLDGTGDGSGSIFTTRALSNMMEHMGVTVDAKRLKVKNIAAVLVTAKLSSQRSIGSQFDVTVSSIGDAKSLQGGTLVLTPLSDQNGIVRGIAQGAVSIGGFNVQVDEGNKIVNNYTLVGRVPSGGKVTNVLETIPGSDRIFNLALINPDITTSYRIAQRINIKYGTVAYPVDGGTVKVLIPDSIMYPTLRSKFLSDVGHMLVVPDAIARIVVNEKTGTIVAGQHVTIEPVAIAHGTITVNIQSRPIISQPEPFSQGETVITQEPYLSVDAQKARVINLKRSATLSDITDALNKIGATPRDIIAILQALKQAGALRAELVIL